MNMSTDSTIYLSISGMSCAGCVKAVEDLLLITSDHGNDPTTPGTDHSREYVPILAALGQSRHGSALGVRCGLNDIAATVLEHWQHPQTLGGESFHSVLGAS